MTTPLPPSPASQGAAPGWDVFLALVNACVLYRATNQVDSAPTSSHPFGPPQQDSSTGNDARNDTDDGRGAAPNPGLVPPSFLGPAIQRRRLRAHYRLGTRYQLQVVPARQATELARTAHAQPDLARALQTLREEAGLSIRALVDKVPSLAGISRTTISRVCNSGPNGGICATPEALEAIVRACGVPDNDVQIWLDARERAFRAQQTRGRRPADSPQVPDIPRPNAVNELATVRDDISPPALNAVQNTDDDAVIGEVPFTARHLRTAIALSAIAGLTASTAAAPGMRHAGNVILGIAATLALIDLIRTTTAAHTAAA